MLLISNTSVWYTAGIESINTKRHSDQKMTWNCTNKVGTFKDYEDLMELTKAKGS